jgi:UDP-N-acetylglucosamine 2-epimerase (non-hydrolysing)
MDRGPVRIVSVVGARPQFVKLAPVAQAFATTGHEHLIVHTGQHYDHGMSDVFFDDLRIPAPDTHLGIGSGSHGVQTGAMLQALDPVLAGFSPDWVLVYGDTNSTLAATLSAVKQHLPVAHLEAGLRSFNRVMPEEHNRVLTDHAADLLLAPTEVAMGHLADEGLADRARLVGDVMTDVCLATEAAMAASPVPLPAALGKGPFLLATLHRAENTDDPQRLGDLLGALRALPVSVLLLAHPRLRQRALAFGLELSGGAVVAADPVSYPEMVSLVLQSDGVVTDSGGLQKEAFLLQRPCTTLRTETEWVETLVGDSNVLVEEASRIEAAVTRPRPEPSGAQPYGDGHAAERVVQALTG